MANPLSALAHRIEAVIHRVHIVYLIYAAGAFVIGWIEEIRWFWLVTVIPLTLGVFLAIHAEWFSGDEWDSPFDWPWWGLIPLDVAARRAFKRLRGTIWADWALQQPTPNDRLDHMAKSIAEKAPRIYGRKPPGVHQEIAGIAKRIGIVRGGGTCLHMHGNQKPSYEDLQISRYDFWWALKSMKQQADERTLSQRAPQSLPATKHDPKSSLPSPE